MARRLLSCCCPPRRFEAGRCWLIRHYSTWPGFSSGRWRGRSLGIRLKLDLARLVRSGGCVSVLGEELNYFIEPQVCCPVGEMRAVASWRSLDQGTPPNAVPLLAVGVGHGLVLARGTSWDRSVLKCRADSLHSGSRYWRGGALHGGIGRLDSAALPRMDVLLGLRGRDPLLVLGVGLGHLLGNPCVGSPDRDFTAGAHSLGS